MALLPPPLHTPEMQPKNGPLMFVHFHDYLCLMPYQPVLRKRLDAVLHSPEEAQENHKGGSSRRRDEGGPHREANHALGALLLLLHKTVYINLQ